MVPNRGHPLNTSVMGWGGGGGGTQELMTCVQYCDMYIVFDFHTHFMILNTIAIRENNESPFVTYTTLEIDH